MEETLVRLGSNGRLVIPSQYRKALELEEGDDLLIRLIDGELRLTTRRAAIRHAQERVRRHVPADRSLVDELLAERRAEARRDE